MFKLIDVLQEVNKDFERTMSDMAGTFTETVQNYFTQVRRGSPSQSLYDSQKRRSAFLTVVWILDTVLITS